MKQDRMEACKNCNEECHSWHCPACEDFVVDAKKETDKKEQIGNCP